MRLVIALVTLAHASASLAQSVGTVTGIVYDASSGEPLPRVGVTVVETEQRSETDGAGAFRIEVTPGAYTLRFAAPGYSSTTVADVVVSAAGRADASASLNPTGAVIDILEIVAEAHQAAEATQLLERKVASYVSDNIGAQLIRQSPDSDAADVVQRLPAITVRDDKFIFIRGLGERYSGALLNGSRLPSTDPDKRVVSLDLFPATFIESLSIKKTFSPEFPGDSSAIVDIRLKRFPDEPMYSIGVSTSMNTAATFQNFGTYDGSGLDYVGFGARYRELPSILAGGKLSGDTTITDSRQRELHSAFHNTWDVDTTTGLPGWGANAAAGNSFGPFGFMLAGTYGTNHKIRRNWLVRQVLSRDFFEGDPNFVDDFRYDLSTFETRLGAILTSGYQIDAENRLGVQAFVNRASEDRVLDGSGRLGSVLEGQDVFFSRLRYREDQLAFGQVEGAHELPGIDIEWRTSVSQTSREDPDQRFVRRTREAGTLERPKLVDRSPSLLRTFGSLSEWMSDSGVDATVPVTLRTEALPAWDGQEIKLKFGSAYTYRDRDFEQRRFRYLFGLRLDLVDLTQPTERLLVPENIGALGRNPFEFREIVDPSDNFSATQEIAASYAMVDVPLLPDTLRLVAGTRVEYSLIRSLGTTNAGNPANVNLKDVDPLPSVNFIYSPRDDMNVRYGFSKTVSRPEFRELTPTQFPTADAVRTELGNANLVSTDIAAHDLRWEWFLSDTEIVSLSFFEKEIPNAIERVTKPLTSTSVDGFRNASAYIWGFEAEVRRNLGFLAPPLARLAWVGSRAHVLDSFSLITNLSFIESKADVRALTGEVCQGDPRFVPDACSESQTNPNRRLQGQAPYVVNAALQYDHDTWGTYRLLYNTIGPQIIAAGADGLDDIIEERRDQLDFVWLGKIEPFSLPLQAKIGIENILDSDHVATQQKYVIDRYRSGVSFGFSLTYTY